MKMPAAARWMLALVALGASACAGQRAATQPTPLPAQSGTPQPSAALRILDVTLGTGAVMAPRQCVYVHYTGWLANGKQFDSSRDTTADGTAGPPISFPQGVRRVIAGWDLGFEGMRVGGQRRLFIPYHLAYGKSGSPPVIPGKADLIFDIELLAVADTLPRTEPRVRGQTPPQCPTWTKVSGER